MQVIMGALGCPVRTCDRSNAAAQVYQCPEVTWAPLQVSGLTSQTALTDLWLNDNKVKDLDHLKNALASCSTSLQVLYLENTPAAKSTDAYLLMMKELLPSLEYLDSTPIKR
jgi:hypothetical protein